MKSARYLVPNSCTALSMLFGCASAIYSSSGQFELAAWLILWGVLLDKLDGLMARLMNATSEFGVQFDSFADFIVFGIAPAALVYHRLAPLEQFQGALASALLVSATGLYVVATAGRLARFNIVTMPNGDSLFYGVPTTLVGATLASGYLTCQVYGLSEDTVALFPIFLLIGAGAMVSNLRLPKLKSRQNPLIHWFQIINIGAVYTLTPLQLWPEYLLALCIMYLAIGLTWGLMNPGEENLSPSGTTS
ncbi:MAG: CDP-alcohol phosphatidyltransferase family protein [Myxococcota bacterium]|nr:CDP-alcohol phosphatidyltransferase family protein [Myxococcota bacterium]